MDELIRLLEDLCGRLDRVRYRTTVALQLLRAGETRFLPRAADEIHDAVDQLAHVELLRAATVTGVAHDLGIPDDQLTLERIIARASAAHASRLRDLQERLRRGFADLQELIGSGTVVATTELDTIRRSLGRWSGSAATAGYGVAPPVAPSRYDGSL